MCASWLDLCCLCLPLQIFVTNQTGHLTLQSQIFEATCHGPVAESAWTKSGSCKGSLVLLKSRSKTDSSKLIANL